MLCVVALPFLLSLVSAYDWSEAEGVLKTAIADGAFPSCSATVAYKGQILLKTAFGKFTYFPNGLPPPLNNGTNPDVTVDTVFDMASCSKVMATTTAAAILYQQGHLDIHAPVSKYLGPSFNQNNKSTVTVLNCLLHNAGYPPDPSPGYWEKAGGCPASQNEHPAEDWSCSSHIFNRLLAQTLAAPVGSVYVYSDLSFITLSYVIGSIVMEKNLVNSGDLNPSCASQFPGQSNNGLRYLCYFEAFVRVKVFDRLHMGNTRYLLPRESWRTIPPTRTDTWYRHATSQGYVDDENAYAMGGISGHAGVFSTLSDVFTLMETWLFEKHPDILNATTIKLWTTEYDHSLSSRALGWNTNDPTVPDGGWGGTCGHLSTSTYLHIGFTGTQICADPKNEILTVLLTNRVYPSGSNTKIQGVRKLWNDAVAKQFHLLNEEEEDNH